jgi:hypothetical protein
MHQAKTGSMLGAGLLGLVQMECRLLGKSLEKVSLGLCGISWTVSNAMTERRGNDELMRYTVAGQIHKWRAVECDWVAGDLSIDAGEDGEIVEVASG